MSRHSISFLYSSYDLAQDLLGKEIIFHGIMPTNERELSSVLKTQQELHFVRFAFGGSDKQITRLAHHATESKRVYMISTLHRAKHASAAASC